MKLLISAAETSSDRHAAALLASLRRRDPALRALGLGGPALRAEGFDARLSAENFLAMGFVEVLGKLRAIARALDELEALAVREGVDAAILVDYPEFHLKLAARLGRRGIPVYSFIPPKVWAWRSHRVEKLKRLFRKIFLIFPFERDFYRERGANAEFVGNPLLDELPLGLSRAEARAKLGLSDADEVLLLMPGSRPGEIRYHLDLMLEAAELYRARLAAEGRALQVVMPLPETAPIERIREKVRASPWSAKLSLRVSQGDGAVAMRAADAGVVKSGTSTLEAALMGCPQVVIYDAHPVSKWIFRTFVRYERAISLANLVAESIGLGERIVPELILERLTPANVAATLAAIDRPKMRAQYAELERSLRPEEGGSPSDRLAESLLADLAGAKRGGESGSGGSP